MDYPNQMPQELCLEEEASHKMRTRTGDRTELLASFTDEELQAELRKRNKSHKPLPAFKCENCGAVGYYVGHFKAHWFEMQKASFDKEHAKCLPTFNGGCI